MPQKKINLLLKIPIVSGIVKKKIRTALGLSNAKFVYTGAAAIPIALMEWWQKMGIEIREAYAMTENCCYSHISFNDQYKFGFVGRPLKGCEHKISEIGEICVKNPSLMLGYYKEPALTKEAFDEEGYLRTGDKGEIDADGYLKITGRVKDIFKTSKGKYVSPGPIELSLAANSDIEQICIVGKGIPQAIALIVLSEQASQCSQTELQAGLGDSLVSLNAVLEKHEKIKSIIVLKEAWTVENNLLTPTMKIKRQKIDDAFGSEYANWFEKNEDVIFV
ncbi:UNVERIFIED_CONTAM: hypothetical protein GTU68_037510 [Idotea baltica]|nr:hypothetical protein [Idotea baltica]